MDRGLSWMDWSNPRLRIGEGIVSGGGEHKSEYTMGSTTSGCGDAHGIGVELLFQDLDA